MLAAAPRPSLVQNCSGDGFPGTLIFAMHAFSLQNTRRSAVRFPIDVETPLQLSTDVSVCDVK